MWNADLYNKFGKERIQPSRDLTTRIVIDDCKRILDVGCGSGMSTYCIKERFPNAEITGVDLSENMLNKASELVPDATWVQRDCRKSLEDLGKFDVVFSNAFLQWIDKQEEFIKNTRNLLNENGVFAIQIPSFENMEIAKIIKKTAAEFDSDNLIFSNIEITCFNYTNEEYYNMFSAYYTDVEMWQTDYYHQMSDSDSIVNFIKSTALIPYLECLTDEQADNFLNMLRKETSKYYKACKNGKVLFPFYRLFLTAKA
jgi:trans-aconitate 2-methyltransferase